MNKEDIQLDKIDNHTLSREFTESDFLENLLKFTTQNGVTLDVLVLRRLANFARTM